jgi:hypothetical protein
VKEGEKPLHVRVAEALGLVVTQKPVGNFVWYRPEFLVDVSVLPERKKDCVPFDGDVWAEVHEIPRYDTDWAAGGPLIDRFGINLTCDHQATSTARLWEAWYQPGDVWLASKFGPTVLVAVCNMIIALKEAGKL